jgi:hypothetical protein
MQHRGIKYINYDSYESYIVLISYHTVLADGLILHQDLLGYSFKRHRQT